MMRLSALAVSLLLVIGGASPALAQKGHLTRAGNFVGVKNFVIKQSLEQDMVRVGIPARCRQDVRNLLAEHIIFSYDDHPDLNPRLTVLCEFVKTSSQGVKGMFGKTIGQTGTAGGLQYVYFRNDRNKHVERFIIPEGPKKTAQRGNPFLWLASLNPTGTVQATRSGMNGSTGTMMSPVPNCGVSSAPGWRTHPVLGVKKFHNGADIPCSSGTPIVAPCDGTVVSSGMRGSAGLMTVIKCKNGNSTTMMHQSGTSVTAGQDVTMGQPIGRVGNTGRSTGAHLHYEIRDANGNLMNPLTMASIPSTPLTGTQMASLNTQISMVDSALGIMRNQDGGIVGDSNGCGDFDSGASTGRAATGCGDAGWGDNDGGYEGGHDEGDGHDHDH